MKSNKIDIDFIKENGRFRIFFFDISKFIIFFLGLSILISLFFIKVDNLIIMKFPYLVTFFFIQTIVSLLLLWNILRQLSFQSYETTLSQQKNFEVVRDILNKLNLPFYSIEDGSVIYSKYKSGMLNLYKKDINFIISDSIIMLNVRNSNPSIFEIFPDKKKQAIKNELQKCIQTTKLLYNALL